MKSGLSFKQFIKNDPFDKKILIVPNYTIGEQIKRAANDQGIACINLECRTIGDLANEIVYRQATLNHEEVRQINGEMARQLMMDIIDDQLHHLAYFVKPEWIDRATAAAIIRQIDDIRMIEGQDSLSAEADSPKLRDLLILLEAYEKRLDKESLVDHVILLKQAIDYLKSENSYDNGRFGIFANTPVIGLEENFIKVLASEKIEIIKAPKIVGIDRPLNFYVKDPDYFEEGNDLTSLYGEEDRSIQDPNVGFFRSYGQVNEFKYVLQDILEHGYAMADVHLLFSHSSYALLLYNYAHTIGINLSLPGGIPGYHSEIYAFLRDLFTFVKNGYFVEDLKAVLYNRSLKIETQKRSNRRLFEALKNEGIGFGRNRYEKVIQKFLLFKDSSDEIDQDFFKFGEFLNELLKLFPEDLLVSVKLKTFTQGIADFLLRYCSKDNYNGDYSRDLQQFAEVMYEFAAFSTIEMSAKNAMEQLQLLIEDQAVQSRTEAEDAILCSSFGTAGIIIRPYVYVIGLDADRFPYKANESPVLLDSERLQLGLTFGQSTAVEKNSIYRLLESLSANIKRLVFGYSYFDTVGIKEKNASSFYNRLLEIQKIDKETIPKSGFINKNKNILEEKEYYIFAAKAQSEQVIFDKISRSPVDLWDRVKPSESPGNNLSASSIMVFLDCPRKYFYKYRTYLKPPEIIEYQRSIWLDPLQKGLFIHKILEDYVTEMIIGNNEKTFKAAAFNNLYEKNCELMLTAVPYFSQTTYEMERHHYYKDASGSLSKLCDQMKQEEFMPIATELTFGMGLADPVEIPLRKGNVLLLKGSIDRVDALKDGSYRIVDYKTGKLKNMQKKREQGFVGFIQDYVYAIALEHIYKNQASQVSESWYDFPCDRYEHLKTKISKTSKQEALERLNEVVEDINNGHFERCFSNPEKYLDWEKTCQYCDYFTLCQAETCAWEG